jgi:hypothetical protein
MLQKITLACLLFFLVSCDKEREIDNYPNVIPPIIENDYPEIFKIFKSKEE